jgi:hypothetical protein
MESSPSQWEEMKKKEVPYKGHAGLSSRVENGKI